MSSLSDGGARLALRLILDQPLVVKLFLNDITPKREDTSETYRECTNYEEHDLVSSQWAILESGPAEASYPEIIFTPLSAGKRQRIFGYYIVHTPTERLMWAERFDAPDAPYYDVDEIAVRLRFRLGAARA